MRVRKKRWAEEELNSNKLFCNEPTQFQSKWNMYFKNENPIHIELGCGKGTFLTQISQQNPEINYIGIERQTNVIAIALRKANKESFNIAFFRDEVQSLPNFFAPTEVQRIYINFCDPWPKKKWAKRRLTHKNFLDIYKKLFKTKGQIFFKTDNQKLFEFSLNQFANENFKLSNITFDLHNSDIIDNIMTEYEQKFSQQGFPIYRCEAYWDGYQ